MNSHLTIIMQDVARVGKRYAGQHLSRPISCGEFGFALDLLICLNTICDQFELCPIKAGKVLVAMSRARVKASTYSLQVGTIKGCTIRSSYITLLLT